MVPASISSPLDVLTLSWAVERSVCGMNMIGTSQEPIMKQFDQLNNVNAERVATKLQLQ